MALDRNADPADEAVDFDTDAYLRDLVQREDQDRYWAALLAPEPARRDLLALYAFNIELARIPEQVSEPQLGEIRLQWWRETLDAALNGAPGDHPVLMALVDTVERRDLPADQLRRMIEGRRADLSDELLPDFPALEAYLTSTAQPLFTLGMHILGAGEERQALTRHAALAFGLTGLMRALPYHAAHGQVFLPESLLARHGLHSHTILQGTDNADLRAALRDMRERALRELDAFRSEVRGLPRPLRPALLPVALVGANLKRLARMDYNPVREIVQLNPLKRYALIWRAFVFGTF